MAAATAPASAPPKASLDDLYLLLADAEMSVKDVLSRIPQEVLGIAWVRGDVEFGRTAYCTNGNIASAITQRNGAPEAPAGVIIETGIDWSGPKTKKHGRLKSILDERLPVCDHYEKYQYEVCISKQPEVWAWLEPGMDTTGKEQRYARRKITRAEAEKLFDLFVRLSEKGAERLATGSN